MKTLRQIGSLAFVLGLFTVVFAGIPWYVIVPDPSVSRFHCFARREADGSWRLQDMNSSNGTTVNGASVPARGVGPATPVKPGDNVKLGQVQLTFTDATALRDFTLQAAR